jgi:hypothetical protein
MDTKVIAAAMAANVATAVVEPGNLSRMLFPSAWQGVLLWMVASFGFD